MTDCHTHTSISPDGYNMPEDSVKQAEKNGLKAIAITEHCESNRLYSPEEHKELSYVNDEHYFFNYDIFMRSMEANVKLQEQFKSDLIIVNGIELGQATHNFQAAEKIISDERLDFTIASMHELPGCDDFAFLNYNEGNVKNILIQYFDELLKLSQWGKFDVLGHLTYPLRYICGESGIELDISEFDEIIAKIFRNIASSDKGIEVNTSGLRQKYGKPFPELKYIKLFHDCGGKIITIGSDAHRTSDIGKSINDGIELVKTAGFESIFYFVKHTPHKIRI